MHFRSGSQIREDFLRFFESKGHRRVHSSSLVPANDPTLLFTNAGMNQFKDVFLGLEKRDYTRAVSSQKCVRAGGKHNDLENVGFTRRHHTFFEMLGNFSFGDYFKRDAIAYAWELLTSEQWFGIDPARLYVTIFEGDSKVARDDDAERLWIETGVPRERIFAMPGKDNFWQMGETGPCGPCSEIFYDLGLAASESGEDKPFPEDDQRYVEIWNLVFMQFDRAVTAQAPGQDVIVLHQLPKPSIDTGMGLERIACVLQGVLSNYQTDLFTPLIQRAAELTGLDSNSSQLPHIPLSRLEAEGGSGETPEVILARTPQRLGTLPSMTASSSSKVGSLEVQDHAVSDDKASASLRIIADHARAATFLIADGVQPANEGRGYVLRKILRRAIRHGRLLGQEQPFLYQMVYAVRDEMRVAYPELAASAERVSKVVLAEEQQFARTIANGSAVFESELKKVKDRKGQLFAIAGGKPSIAPDARIQELMSAIEREQDLSQDELSELREFLKPQYQSLREQVEAFPGHNAFHIYETYGLPLDFMVDAVRDAGLDFDMAGFELAKAEEQARARASWKGGSQKSASPVFRELPKTEFEGYSTLRVEGARVLALIKDGLGISELQAGDQGEAVLDATSFYADSGGQVGDIGVLFGSDHQTVIADVQGCTKPVQGVFAHKIKARQAIHLNDLVDTAADPIFRASTTRNHTGTHLLHAALREVLGPHVKQAGSLVNPARLRFDFSHFAGVAEEELSQIESIVNRQVLANTPVQTFVDVPIDEAVNDLHATALFGEKYGERVRVVKIGDFSTELCGGIHTGATGEIGLVKLVGESSVASGVRRVEAVTGTGALDEFRRDFDVARVVTALGGGDQSPAEALRARLTNNDEEIKKLRRELDQMRLKAASASVSDSAGNAVEVKGIKLLTQRVEALDKSQMRDLVDQLRTRLGSGVVVLGAASDGRVSLIVGVTKDLTSRIQAGKLVAALAPLVGGKGGGRPDLAEAGGNAPEKLDAALAEAAGVLASLV